MDNNPILHVSFDFWRTLFKSNEMFSNARVNLLHNEYNPLGLSLHKISQMIEAIGEKIDKINSITLESFSASEMNAELLINFGVDPSFEDLKIFEKRITDLFLEYPPILYTNITKKILEKLFDMNITMSLASNTAFIMGDTLDLVLKAEGLLNFFKFQIYSDKLNQSKPSIEFFNSVYKSTLSINDQINFKSNILHVGDNFIADIQGASNFGFKTFQINSNKLCINDIFNETNNFSF
jgi:putative hydrolase of the HAD superfamily